MGGMLVKDWIQFFCLRHDIGCRTPSRQDSERFRYTNAYTLLRHFRNVQDLQVKYNIDGCRLFNLDETDVCAECDCHGSWRKKEIVPTGYRPSVQSAHFESNYNHVTLLATVCAGESSLPLWIFKDTRLPFAALKYGNGVRKVKSAV